MLANGKQLPERKLPLHKFYQTQRNKNKNNSGLDFSDLFHSTLELIIIMKNSNHILEMGTKRASRIKAFKKNCTTVHSDIQKKKSLSFSHYSIKFVRQICLYAGVAFEYWYLSSRRNFPLRRLPGGWHFRRPGEWRCRLGAVGECECVRGRVFFKRVNYMFKSVRQCWPISDDNACTTES